MEGSVHMADRCAKSQMCVGPGAKGTGTCLQVTSCVALGQEDEGGRCERYLRTKKAEQVRE